MNSLKILGSQSRDKVAILEVNTMYFFSMNLHENGI